MIKKFQNFIQELSLTQQLLVIIFFFTITFVSFFVAMLGPNIDTFVENQIYTVLELSQTDLIFSYEKGVSMSEMSGTRPNYTLGHIIVVDNQTYYAGQQVADQKAMDWMITSAINQEEQHSRYSVEIDDDSLYYTISKNNSFLIISYMYETFGLQVRDTLLSTIINSTVFVVFSLFILLLLWVATIITPLRQIQLYIERLKVGQKAELRVTRQDEIGELANALVALSEELEYQEQMKTELIHNISHDLKTPIATIKSYGESIKDGIYPYETLEKSVDVIIQHAERLEKKVHSLLLLNRLSFEDSEMVSDNVDVNMEEVISQVCLSIKVIKPNIEFICDVNPTVFRGNFENWRITVENIVDNALRYAESKIWITLKDGELIIENDGSHISEDRLRSIFKAYEKGTDGNFGLGLSIAYKVATNSGYFIRAINTERGVAFKISKPKI